MTPIDYALHFKHSEVTLAMAMHPTRSVVLVYFYQFYSILFFESFVLTMIFYSTLFFILFFPMKTEEKKSFGVKLESIPVWSKD